ncbi:uncharacterized protein LOC143865549 [Tasmannia lanceolata]|uniref:uncharacterized protein LOC143865549 n=1 Tax=Tasmannia lanceolata TaxID=3420 RepID=UPI00406360DD
MAGEDYTRPEKFEGLNFKRWQQSLFFWLSTLKIAYVLTTPKPSPEEHEPAQSEVTQKWENDDFLCRGYIFSAMTNFLYDVYCGMKTAKEMWDALDKKYKTEDAGVKKSVVGNYLRFEMVDGKPVLGQVHEFQLLLNEILAEGIKMDDRFHSAAIIDKLPPSWKEFEKSLKHRKYELSLEDLLVTLRIEEEHRNRDQNDKESKLLSKANLVETSEKKTNKSFGSHQNKKKMENRNHFKSNKKIDKNKKKEGCFNCGKLGHYARQCRHRKGKDTFQNVGNSQAKPAPQANMVESGTVIHGTEVKKLITVDFEVNMVFNVSDWWVDTGATIHVCCDRSAFVTYHQVDESEMLFMGNSSTAKVMGKWKVDLKLTSGKVLTLHQVLYVPEVRKNLISGYLLNKHGYKLVFEYDKFILTKGGMFVGKGYACGGLFKLNVSINEINKISDFSAYIIETYDMWHVPKQWHEKFDKVVLSNGFTINDSDKCGYSRFEGNSGVLICLYVDDMLIIGTSLDVINDTKNLLLENFDMKDLGLADVILGIKIIRNSEGTVLTQSHYVKKILKKFNKFDCTPLSVPYDPSSKLKKNTGKSISQLEYSRIIGSLMYLMNCTRPDIAYAVGRLSRYSRNPSQGHWDALIRILRYLKGTMEFGLHYSRYPAVLEGYSDANWILDSEETKSTSGYVFTLGGGAVAWKSTKQTCRARSTMESEFIALDKAGEEAEWIRNLLADIPLWCKPIPAISIHCDSQATIARAKSRTYNGKSRHIV